MEFKEVVKTRKSTRAFLPQEVDKEIFKQIMEVGNKTPSWGNSQPWEVYVATGKTLENIKKRHAEYVDKKIKDYSDIPAAGYDCWPPHILKNIIEWKEHRMDEMHVTDEEAFFAEFYEQNKKLFDAPAVIYLCMDKMLCDWSLYDVGAFSMSIQLAAVEYGLQTISAYLLVGYPDILREEMGIPENTKIVFGLGIGYPDKDHLFNQQHTSRKPLDEFLSIKD
ncbi:MAG: nitroreductase [Desulfitobacterium hafniense]|nr:nitroreductase [Desulfitobacterium hafniense]